MRGIGRAMKGVALSAALLGVSSGAMGAAGAVKTTVTVLSDPVTYSTLADDRKPAFIGFLGARFDVSNTSGNTINKVTWVATFKVATPTEIIAFDSADRINISMCTFSSAPPLREANELTITCPFGQMRGNETRTFSLFFKSPIADSPVIGDNVSIYGTTITAEGANGGNSWDNSIDEWPLDANGNLAPAVVLLGTKNPERIKSAVPKGGATFFTGNEAPLGFDDAIGLDDGVATKVTLPAAVENQPFPDFAEITEVREEGCNSLTRCYKVTLDVAGTFSPYWSITLRADKSIVKKGVKIESIGFNYTANNGTVTPITNDDRCINGLPYPIGHARYGVPCILSSQVYKPGYKLNPDLQSDYEWIFLNTKNGIFQFF